MMSVDQHFQWREMSKVENLYFIPSKWVRDNKVASSSIFNRCTYDDIKQKFWWNSAEKQMSVDLLFDSLSTTAEDIIELLVTSPPVIYGKQKTNSFWKELNCDAIFRNVNVTHNRGSRWHRFAVEKDCNCPAMAYTYFKQIKANIISNAIFFIKALCRNMINHHCYFTVALSVFFSKRISIKIILASYEHARVYLEHACMKFHRTKNL